MQQKPSKAYLISEIQHIIPEQGTFRILEMGCGTGSQLAALVREHPGVSYVGIEPSAEAAEKAREYMGPRENVRVVTGLAYDMHEREHAFPSICVWAYKKV